MYSYFLVWSPASKPSDGNIFHLIGCKFVESWNSPPLLASVLPFPKFSRFFFKYETNFKRLAWSIKLWLFSSSPTKNKSYEKPVWKRQLYICFSIAARSSNWKFKPDFLEYEWYNTIGVFFFFLVCSIQVPDRTVNVHVNFLIRKKRPGIKKMCLSRHPLYFSAIYFWMGKVV